MGGTRADTTRSPPCASLRRAACDIAQDGEYDDVRAEAANDDGVAASAAGDYPRAHASFTEAVRLAPSRAVYHANRASAALRLGNAAGAAEDAEHAVSISPGSAVAHLRAARSHVLLRHPEVCWAHNTIVRLTLHAQQALEHYDAVLAQQPSHVAALRGRSVRQMCEGSWLTLPAQIGSPCSASAGARCAKQ